MPVGAHSGTGSRRVSGLAKCLIGASATASKSLAQRNLMPGATNAPKEKRVTPAAHSLSIESFMRCRRLTPLIIALLGTVLVTRGLPAQDLTTPELARVDQWFHQAVERTGDGQWGVVIGSMDGRVLWSANPELELIPASTAKLFTVGFTRARAGGGARIATRVIGRGSLDLTTRRWVGGGAARPGGGP